jgi:hypothetical protein
MAYVFQPESTPVLFFGPKNHVPYNERRLWLLWPVFVYRVIAPLPAGNKSLNIFQKAVLGFAHIKETRSDVIGRHLHLQSELIELILKELRRKDLLTSEYHTTAEGERLVREEMEEMPSEILAGNVFQDPWHKQLWPRVVDKLQFAPTEYEKDDIYPTLVFGTTGKQRHCKPFLKRSDFNANPALPSVQDILDASDRHQRDITKISKSGIVYETDEEIKTNIQVEIDNPRISKISLISESPEPYYLTTFLYRPENDPRPGEWYVCDPFGLGASATMRRWIDNLTKHDDLLRERLENWLQKTEAITSITSSSTNLADQAKIEVQLRFSESAELMPFWPQMIAMVRSELEIADAVKLPHDKLRDVLVKAAITLESVLDHVRTQYPAPGCAQIYNTADRKYRHELLNGIAANIGFLTPVPHRLANIDPQRVQKTENSGGTLGERLTSAILAARSQPDHPFYLAAQKMPDMLTRISQLIYLRGQSSHFTDYVPTIKEISDYVDLTITISKLLNIKNLLQEGENHE